MFIQNIKICEAAAEEWSKNFVFSRPHPFHEIIKGWGPTNRWTSWKHTNKKLTNNATLQYENSWHIRKTSVCYVHGTMRYTPWTVSAPNAHTAHRPFFEAAVIMVMCPMHSGESPRSHQQASNTLTCLGLERNIDSAVCSFLRREHADAAVIVEKSLLGISGIWLSLYGKMFL